ncbi:MAG: M81 family metallopeptidase [Planctomycetaceae bacterium]
MTADSPTKPVRIAIGGILTECNSFGGLPIDLATYEASELLRGNEILQMKHSVVGGMLHTLETRGATPVPLIYASACSAGPMTEECYQQIRKEFVAELEKALPVDGVLLPMHGSSVAYGEDDPEGDLVHIARELVGPDVPVIVSLDLHANVTDRMVHDADALLAWETYPHVDQFITGERAARLLFDMLDGKCKPTMAMGKVPVITSGVHGSTNDPDPFAELMRFTKSLETREEVLTTSLILVHPYIDCPRMGSGGIVVTNNNLELAEELAAEIGRRYWDRRQDFEPEMFTPAAAIEEGLKIKGGPVILVEAADCCGAGPREMELNH